jgi:hypothetical protein
MITANPIKHKKGDIRNDGMIFWCYGKNFTNGQYWVTKEKFDHLNQNQREWRINSENPEKRKERQKRWYASNSAKKLEKLRIYREINRDKIRKKDRENKSKNKEKHRASSRDWNKKNKDRFKENLAIWKEKNKDRYRLLIKSGAAKYRARKRNACVKLSEAQEKIIKTIYDLSQRLENRIGIKFHVDHIVPLAKGGLHIPSNLQVLPATLNHQKKDLKVFHWSEYQPA